MRGSILVTFDELVNDRGIDYFDVYVNSVFKDRHFTDVNNYYSTYCFPGDTIDIYVFFETSVTPLTSFKRYDYTTDAEGDDNGIKETLIYPTLISSGSFLYQYRFTATTIASAYNFHYVANIRTKLKNITSIQLGYDASDPYLACQDYITSPSTYYVTYPEYGAGTYIFTNSGCTISAPAGYYSNGTYVYYVATNGPLQYPEICVSPTPTPTPTLTPTPTPTPTPEDNSGQYLIAGQYYIEEPNDSFPYCSSDNGVNFTSNSPTTPVTLTAIGRDGNMKYIATSRYYNSDNFNYYNGYVRKKIDDCGSVFGYLQLTALGYKDWSKLVLSGDGSYGIFGATDGTLKYTNDSGNTFNDYTFVSGYSVSDVAISNDASIQCWSLKPVSGTTSIVINSNDGGNTWTGSTTTISSSYGFNVMMNYNTDIRMVLSFDGKIYKSTDYGDTFSTQTISFSGRTIIGVTGYDMSDSGQYQYIVYQTGYGTPDRRLIVSSDYGNTWTENTSVMNLLSVRTSKTGKNVYIIYNDQIYKSTDYGVNFSYLNSLPNNKIASISCSKE